MLSFSNITLFLAFYLVIAICSNSVEGKYLATIPIIEKTKYHARETCYSINCILNTINLIFSDINYSILLSFGSEIHSNSFSMILVENKAIT